MRAKISKTQQDKKGSLIIVFCSCSYGSLEVVPLGPRMRRCASKSANVTATIRPQKITALDNEEESTTKDVKKMFVALKEACDQDDVVHYFRFLLDPTSFARSVENIFHFSFLIKVTK